MQLVTTRFQQIDDAPLTSHCQFCRAICNRQWVASRAAIDIVSEGQSLLDVRVGVYWCQWCKRHQRNNPNFISPRALFTNRVANIAVASVVEDGMPITKVVRRIERDFGIRISETAIRRWISSAASLQGVDEGHPKVIDETSGVLCIDEAYSGALALLIATDPGNSDKLVGYLVGEKSFDQGDVERFLFELKNSGIDPDQVVTDESALYLEVIKKVWPKTAHQLCLFHLGQKITESAKKAVRDLRITTMVVRITHTSIEKLALQIFSDILNPFVTISQDNINDIFVV